MMPKDRDDKNKLNLTSTFDHVEKAKLYSTSSCGVERAKTYSTKLDTFIF